MLELLVLSITLGGFAAGGVTAFVQIKTKGLESKKFHVNPELEAPTPGRSYALVGDYQLSIESARKPIPADIQAELDQSPEWWDKKYHAALKGSGAKVVARELGEIIEEKSFNGNTVLYHQDDREALAGCECRECVQVMKSSGPAGSDLDLSIYSYEDND